MDSVITSFAANVDFLEDDTADTTFPDVKKKVVFIINPISGIGKQRGIERAIKKHFDEARFDIKITYTQKPQDGTKLAKEAVENGFDIVVAVGGDGSVNEIAQVLIGTKTALGIIPAGSGNGLARHLGIPINTKRALQLISHGSARTIDSVKINDQFFVGIAGIGFDAKVSETFTKIGHRGLLAYLRAILKELPKYSPNEYELTIDGKPIKMKAFLISVANIAQYGNNFQIAPQAIVDDGYLDVLVIKDFSFLSMPRLLFELMARNDNFSKYIQTMRCKTLTIQNPKHIVHIDGEPIKMDKDILIRILPSSLNVIAPKQLSVL